MEDIAMTIKAIFDGAENSHRRRNRAHRVGVRLTQSIGSRLRDQFPMIHPLILAAVAAESEGVYYSEEPRKGHSATTGAARAPAEHETPLMETSVVEAPGFGDMRDWAIIDAELRLLAAERLAHRRRPKGTRQSIRNGGA